MPKKNKNKNKVKDRDSQVFNFVNITLLSLFAILIVLPVWNIFISSFATGTDLANGFGLFPKHLTVSNYVQVLQDSTLWQAFGVSVAKTVVGTITHVAFTAIVAYPMAKYALRGRKIMTGLGIFTMMFGGGMIPYFLLIKALGLLNSFWVYIIPGLFSYFDMIIIMNFFRNLPTSLEESARIDGATDWQVFTKIYLPLSRPALAVIGLWTAVGQWNDFFTALLYINDKNLYPLQMRIYQIIVQAQLQQQKGYNPLASQIVSQQGIQLATVVFTALPILIAYPFLQKYFVEGGLTLGAVKE